MRLTRRTAQARARALQDNVKEKKHLRHEHAKMEDICLNVTKNLSKRATTS